MQTGGAILGLALILLCAGFSKDVEARTEDRLYADLDHYRVYKDRESENSQFGACTARLKDDSDLGTRLIKRLSAVDGVTMFILHLSDFRFPQDRASETMLLHNGVEWLEGRANFVGSSEMAIVYINRPIQDLQNRGRTVELTDSATGQKVQRTDYSYSVIFGQTSLGRRFLDQDMIEAVSRCYRKLPR